MMTFDDYISIWYKKHPLAQYMDDASDGKHENGFSYRNTVIMQKLDWIAYCKDNSDVVRPNDDFFNQLFCELIEQLTESVYEKNSIMFGGFIDFFNAVSSKQTEKYDAELINSVIELLNTNLSFEHKLILFLSWARNRQEFLEKVELGFSSIEAGRMSAFYTRYRDKFIIIRETDYLSMKDIAKYFLFMYDACKHMDRCAMAGDIVKINSFLLEFMRDVLASSVANGYYEDEEQIKAIIEGIKAETDPLPSIFISYCWEDSDIADSIEEGIRGLAHIHRDKHDIHSGDSLTSFMKTIRTQDFVILIISDKYLEKRNCMYEVLQLLKDYEDSNSFWSKIIPFVTATGIYDVKGRAKKIKYWTEACKQLDDFVSGIPSSASEELDKEVKVLRYISMEIGKLIEHISDELCDRDLTIFINNTKKKLEKWAKYADNPIKDAILAALQTGAIKMNNT